MNIDEANRYLHKVFLEGYHGNRIFDELYKIKAMKEERTLKMSLETARKIWTEAKSMPEISISLNHLHGLLLENFTKEELEDKKGFCWRDSFKGEGYRMTATSEFCHISNINFSFVKRQDLELFRTKKQALSALAFAQLTYIVARYNKNTTEHLTENKAFTVTKVEGKITSRSLDAPPN